MKFDGQWEWKKLRQTIEKDTELKRERAPKRLYKNSLKEKRDKYRQEGNVVLSRNILEKRARNISNREYLEGSGFEKDLRKKLKLKPKKGDEN